MAYVCGERPWGHRPVAPRWERRPPGNMKKTDVFFYVFFNVTHLAFFWKESIKSYMYLYYIYIRTPKERDKNIHSRDNKIISSAVLSTRGPKKVSVVYDGSTLQSRSSASAVTWLWTFQRGYHQHNWTNHLVLSRILDEYDEFGCLSKTTKAWEIWWGFNSLLTQQFAQAQIWITVGR